ncbi:uncharacterized protein LOC128394625 [Panonychus citri]|uniref:uncharacterized protein LOC128394625 n=1 Tax=Panonychus citri TaxID=50023 RepID=UPI002307B82C|nr:uncharacterized protein LOC128394625 [Panonychus citri]
MRDDSSENMSLLANYRSSRGEVNDGYRSGSMDANLFTFNQPLQPPPFSTSSYFATSSSSSSPSTVSSPSSTSKPSSTLSPQDNSGSSSMFAKLSKAIPLTITIMLILSMIGVITLTKHNSSSSHVPQSLHDASSASLQAQSDQLFESTWNESLVVKTECGQYLGLSDDDGFEFRGIRYGLPPIDSLRWSPTQPVWNDSKYCDPLVKKRATKFGSSCFQINPYTKKYQGLEDCLYINIWTPTLNETANLDVMVWIHGGFLQFGSGHDPGLRPSTRLAVNMNTVFVSLNYRLYALGFLNLADLPGTSNSNSTKDLDNLKSITGNYGLSDQLIAFQWIQRNIGKFGGSPEKIITFGSDAGAASILAHLTNSIASKIITKAWIIGPTLFMNRTADSISHIQHFVNRTGCKTIDCLKFMSPEKITQCWLGDNDPSFRIIDQNDLPIIGIYPEQLIHVDGSTITDWLPFHKMDSINQIPLLVGTAAQSIELWPGIEQLRNWTWDEYKKYVTTSLDSFGPNLTELTLRLYPIPEKRSESNNNMDDNTIENSAILTQSNSNYNNDSNNITVNNHLNHNNSSSSNVNSNNLTPELLYATMVSDIRQNCPVDAVFEQLSKKWKNDIYRYVSSGQPSCPIRVYEYESQFSFHLWDAIVFFDTINQFIHHPSSDDLNYRDIVQEMVKNFISNNKSLLPKPYPGSVAILSAINQTIVSSYSTERCNFWKKQGLNSYVWTG